MRSSNDHKSYTVKEATIKLMQFCAYRDRSQKEVEDKLIDMRMIPAAREKIIIQLMSENFLNEERFARSFARGKFRIKKWGKNKIKQELKAKEISTPLVRIALTEIEDEEYIKTLKELAEKKSLQLREKDPFKKRIKLSNFLLQKGFESSLVFDVISDMK